ncbi:hypothetical protein Save01_01633 [Streptomyces avermitilis]|uniref:Uncharacterized protein n=3 Tax=Streptomyces TaxID=1883 RepID=A0A4D4LQP7_STRAX|nr:hypothetical protein SAVMC3_39330 [Streptomyces avermitilis]GDY63345.1 hypothetical protein SAV14893_027380 [Streptomyces avermitilis]GDY76521.1 hypothetical protein SAV31267_060060 [Streptomyces avermitilis]GDY85457.1 hypothetical protein SAVCW2_46560 [Streptomyces avermitilis]
MGRGVSGEGLWGRIALVRGLRRGPRSLRGARRVRPVFAVAMACMVLGAPQAGALGRDDGHGRDIPDLALVIAGGSGRTVVLRSGQRDFARIWQLLGPMNVGTEKVPDAWARGRYPKVRATVVWGLTGIGGWPYTDRAPGGDVGIERQDQVFLAEDGTPWVRTDPAPDVADDDVRWHRATRSVFAEVNRSGLFGAAPAPPADEGPSAVRWGVWGLGTGLALGVGGTLLVRRTAARREGAGPPREPRQELIDL